MKLNHVQPGRPKVGFNGMQPLHNLSKIMALSLSDEEFQRKLQSMPSLAEKNAKKHQPACLSKSAAMISATNGRIDSQVINSPEEKYITGESVIVDEIDKSGARMLMANKMQSELAFAVTRTDVVAFRQTDYILQEQPYEHTQYCFDLLVDFLNNTAACRTRSAVALPAALAECCTERPHCVPLTRSREASAPHADRAL